MTYVKRRGMVLLVDDSEVPKYTGEGFEVLGKPQEAAVPAEVPKKAGKRAGKAAEKSEDPPKDGDGDAKDMGL